MTFCEHNLNYIINNLKNLNLNFSLINQFSKRYINENDNDVNDSKLIKYITSYKI